MNKVQEALAHRHVGSEMHGIMYDYGTLVPIGEGATNGY